MLGRRARAAGLDLTGCWVALWLPRRMSPCLGVEMMGMEQLRRLCQNAYSLKADAVAMCCVKLIGASRVQRGNGRQSCFGGSDFQVENRV